MAVFTIGERVKSKPLSNGTVLRGKVVLVSDNKDEPVQIKVDGGGFASTLGNSGLQWEPEESVVFLPASACELIAETSTVQNVKAQTSDIPDPCVVNQFSDEAEAVRHAKHWSKVRREEWTVIHGQSETGFAFFVEKGDGGMIRATERVVVRFDCGKPAAE